MERAAAKYANAAKFQLWQTESHPLDLLNQEMIQQKLEHIHNNPILAGFVGNQEDWNYRSTADYNGKKGLIDLILLDSMLLSLATQILRNGGNFNIEDVYGSQPLWTAVFNDKGRDDRYEFVKLFIENEADINHKNTVGKSPKDIVLVAGYNKLKELRSFH